MRKTGNAVALTGMALALAAVPNASYAQSSVTLYGIIDAGVTYVSNAGGSHQVKFDDGIAQANRWGLKGTEDLGGGMKAVFELESGFHLGNGQIANGGSLFGRAAYVGLQNDWGTLTLGNQPDMTQEFVYLYNASAWASGYAINQGDFDRMNGDHLQNSVKFMSNTFGGFQFGGMYSFSNKAGDFHNGSAWSVGAQYQHGPFAMGTAYTQLNNPSGIYGFDPYAMIGVRTFFGRPTVSVDPATGTVTSLYADTPFPVDKQATFGAGASYAIGNVTLMGAFTYTQITAFGESRHMQVGEGGANWQMTPSFSMTGGYQYTHFDGHHWNQLSAGMHYLLSKRTDVYLSGDWLRASQGVDAVIGYGFTPASTTTQADVRIGLRHLF
ncbi:porin [Paraburkholderia sp. Ac-20336]|uniref:porin n=1 Tax=Burkholderiaceae TaxID=119060 RepID=UPI00141F9EFD|nr:MULTISPECIES: porin [Burkholderiaceae]MBN3801846.1 porin [Paraburkholderia sp. Ac-20336]NIF55519.1 porin [Burkholderia sp. Ax-1724]NIF81573.1 porin [Paraburkholderia sp. Cy-641]